ncbi:hypothetical protein E1176_12350 [Fulvivirga sp. RKSG066]|uniref:hypothetical protein n=1 Tax=Fulvivirga aurantia TaxID=2529383 RepID=UPI0012BC91DB|nr:hypothetical protein [Fulvivirga aurantia]MTI21814.1 hypothetical protein [Fulvivirga aurantia]
MKTTTLFFLASLTITVAMAQQRDYYEEIPELPENYTAGTVAGRMVDGLGFRFYWATADLRPEDLTYRPAEDTRTILETVDHIYSMSVMIYNAVHKTSEKSDNSLSFEAKRKQALLNFEKVSKVLKASKPEDMESYEVIGRTTNYPFWNLINGPIADCLWHCGQIVSHRRAAGNPFNSNVSVFMGKLRSN